jgi:DNA-binding NarL/FixJ family response regulator
VTIQVLLADDQPLVRGGFRVLLESDPDVHGPAQVVSLAAYRRRKLASVS